MGARRAVGARRAERSAGRGDRRPEGSALDVRQARPAKSGRRPWREIRVPLPAAPRPDQSAWGCERPHGESSPPRLEVERRRVELVPPLPWRSSAAAARSLPPVRGLPGLPGRRGLTRPSGGPSPPLSLSVLASVLYARSCTRSLLCFASLCFASVCAASSGGADSRPAGLDSRHDSRLMTRPDLAAWLPPLPALPALRALPATLPAGEHWSPLGR